MAGVEIGNLWKCRGKFRTLEDVTISGVFYPAGSPADPVVVTVEVMPPDGIKLTYVYGASGSPVIRDSMGAYHIPILLDQAEMWQAIWTGSGVGSIRASSSDGISVNARPFA